MPYGAKGNFGSREEASFEGSWSSLIRELIVRRLQNEPRWLEFEKSPATVEFQERVGAFFRKTDEVIRQYPSGSADPVGQLIGKLYWDRESEAKEQMVKTMSIIIDAAFWMPLPDWRDYIRHSLGGLAEVVEILAEERQKDTPPPTIEDVYRKLQAKKKEALESDDLIRYQLLACLREALEAAEPIYMKEEAMRQKKRVVALHS